MFFINAPDDDFKGALHSFEEQTQTKNFKGQNLYVAGSATYKCS